MDTVYLGVEGEYGRRLSRYLEGHLGRKVRLRHFTKPDQWSLADTREPVYVVRRSFFDGLGQEAREALAESDILWITDTDEEEGYCRFHPPKDLADMILKRLEPAKSGQRVKGGGSRLVGVFSPVDDSRRYDFIRRCIRPGDLYLGMSDLGGELKTGSKERSAWPGQDKIEETGGDMGDLCYYIHLRDPEIMERICELSLSTEGYAAMASPPVCLPLLELSAQDYAWFFDHLKSMGTYGCIYAGFGCGMMGLDGFLSSFDRLFLLTSRENGRVARGCEHILRSVQAGYGGFSGECSLVYREDCLF